ncbi:D-amino-acid transaminase [Sporolactobacillus vineae]|uniref:D-amino-acid transaminase n=1 Tax=Sporolactobacillus vineae TaxID=444463 RepID=UPI0002891120|nr:D-amino-acid transaminase [Sporolactobacillus vineae]
MSQFILYQDQIVPRDQGKVDIEDRGYQFGDGIYEAIAVYSGELFLLDLHMKRLQRSARELSIQLPYSIDHLTDNLNKLIKANAIDDGVVYFQITRGAAPRVHYFPDKIPTVLTGSTEDHLTENDRTKGIRTTLAEDIRWLRCDIKTLNLLGNVLANQKAHELGVAEAILHRGDTVTEGSSSNVFIVKDGKLITHPADHFILNGITRQFVIRLAGEIGIPVDERTYSVDELLASDEAFISSTGNQAMPIIAIDQTEISGGKPGPVTRQINAAISEKVKAFRKAAVSR